MLEVLDLQYQGDSSAAEARLLQLYPVALIQRIPNLTTSITPGSLIVQLPDLTLVIVSGTTTPQQWAQQAFWGTQGRQEFGTFGTLQVWYNASNVIFGRMADAAVSVSLPVTFIGHSYGGVVACLLAARTRTNNPTLELQLLTAGCPKPGDERLQHMLLNIRSCHLVNEDDPVPYIPPGDDLVNDMAAAIPGLYQQLWTGWRRPLGQIQQRTNGQRRDNPSDDYLYGLIFRQALTAITGTPPAVVIAHLTAEYVLRCICPGQPAPPIPTEFTLLSTGGQRQDGSASFYVVGDLHSTGGQIQDGSAGFYHIDHLYSTGGQIQDGGAGFNLRKYFYSTGGQIQDGAATIVSERTFYSTGGQIQDGAAGLVTDYVLYATGGQLQDGAAILATGLVFYSSAGQLQNGIAVEEVNPSHQSTGGQLQDGTGY